MKGRVDNIWLLTSFPHRLQELSDTHLMPVSVSQTGRLEQAEASHMPDRVTLLDTPTNEIKSHLTHLR